ncbi:MAG TPA: ion transporter [Candidatus Limnocylindria bacterium]
MAAATNTETIHDANRELKGVGYEVFILLLSILSVVNLVVTAIGTFIGRQGPALDVVFAMDTIITPFFVFDFFYRLLTASSRSGYFFRGWGWADLLAVIPMFRIFRVFRIIRVVRLLTVYGPRRFLADLVEARAAATFLLTIFLVILVLEVAGASIYYVEVSDAAANIKSAGDAIWWGLVTITTVGYGDRYPVTPEGRIIGTFLLMSGIGLFSVLTGFIANVFLAPPAKPRVAPPPEDPRAMIAAVRALLTEQEERVAAIRHHLDELEQHVRPAAS